MATSCGIADQIDNREVDLDEVREIGELEVVPQQLGIRRHGGGSSVTFSKSRDRLRSGGADVMHVELDLRQISDEGFQVCHPLILT